MPTYLYETEEGKVVEWQARMNAIPQALLVNGKIAERRIALEHKGQRSGNAWAEHSSLALWVHPDQVMKYRKDAYEKGVGGDVRIRDDGFPEFRSASAQKKYCHAYEFVNHDANWSAKENR